MKRLNKVLGRVISDRRIYVATSNQTAHARLTPLRQIGLGLLGTGFVGWTAFATIIIATDAMAPRQATSAIMVQGVQLNRIEELVQDRASFAAQAEASRVRFEQAAAIMSEQQAEIVLLRNDIAEATQITQDQRATLDRRQMALVQRDDALDLALEQVATLANDLNLRSDQAVDLGRTVDVLLQGLSRTAQDRNDMAVELAGFATERDQLEARAILAEQRQERVIDRVERAVEGSIAELDSVFDAAGADIEAMFPTGDDYTGQGGPEVGLDDNGDITPASLDRVSLLLNRISDLNARRDALEHMPFAGPVHTAFRQTSGFGTRRDPFNGSARRHNGLDFAAPVGTPLYATGAGEVIFASRSGAFGNLVRIQHAFGYETLYAHMSRIRVAVGDRVDAGDRIGDMGSTGRSTGSHLHYEVHRDGRPVDPMTYLKAAEDVL